MFISVLICCHRYVIGFSVKQARSGPHPPRKPHGAPSNLLLHRLQILQAEKQKDKNEFSLALNLKTSINIGDLPRRKNFVGHLFSTP